MQAQSYILEELAFYAFGLGSASYVKGLRFSRPRRMNEYMDYVKKLEEGMKDSCGDDHVEADDLAMDVVMLSLRTARGLDLRSFRESFGDSFFSLFARFMNLT